MELFQEADFTERWDECCDDVLIYCWGSKKLRIPPEWRPVPHELWFTGLPCFQLSRTQDSCAGQTKVRRCRANVVKNWPVNNPWWVLSLGWCPGCWEMLFVELFTNHPKWADRFTSLPHIWKEAHDSKTSFVICQKSGFKKGLDLLYVGGPKNE